MCTSKKSEVSDAILSYLLKHPDAQDTLEGIVEWWLVAHMIETRTNVVKEAIADLISRQFLLEDQGKDLRPRYRINRSRVEEIKTVLEHDFKQE
jgi:hypothetical protein